MNPDHDAGSNQRPKPAKDKKLCSPELELLEKLNVISNHSKADDKEYDTKKRVATGEAAECEEKEAKNEMLEVLAQKRVSAVELMVKESLRESTSGVSAAVLASLEEEIEARVTRRLLQERQDFILRRSQSNARVDAVPATSEQLQPPPSMACRTKLRMAELVTTRIPGAVRVAGMNASQPIEEEGEEESFSEDCHDEENPDMLRSSHRSSLDHSRTTSRSGLDQSQNSEMQMPQLSIPEYFELEATLVDENENSGLQSFGLQSFRKFRLFVEAKPVDDDEHREFTFRDIVQNKKMCSLMTMAVLVIVALLLAVIIPLIRS